MKNSRKDSHPSLVEGLCRCGIEGSAAVALAGYHTGPTHCKQRLKNFFALALLETLKYTKHLKERGCKK
jgi:hypothetical protein